MVISPTSRYANVQTATLTVQRNGRAVEIQFLRRRFIPPATGDVTLVHHTIKQGDRLDNITARYLTDPTAFWRVCDTNRVLRPDELLSPLGRTIEVALPLLVGLR
jgi:hypothetical protein